MIITLTNTEYKKFLLSLEQIESVLPTNHGCEIISKSGEHYVCQETVSEVDRLIEEAERE